MCSVSSPDTLIINEEDIEHHIRPEPTFPVIFDPYLNKWGSYRIRANQIIFGKHALSMTPEANHGAIRHEKTHGVFYNLPPELQVAVCRAFTTDSDPAKLVAFCRYRIERGDPPTIYQRDLWTKPEFQTEFHKLGRGMFADIEIEFEGQKYFTPQIISEILAYLAIHNNYNWSSTRANEPVSKFVTLAASLLLDIKPTTLELLKTSGLLFVTGTNEFQSLQNQITDVENELTK